MQFFLKFSQQLVNVVQLTAVLIAFHSASVVIATYSVAGVIVAHTTLQLFKWMSTLKLLLLWIIL